MTKSTPARRFFPCHYDAGIALTFGNDYLNLVRTSISLAFLHNPNILHKHTSPQENLTLPVIMPSLVKNILHNLEQGMRGFSVTKSDFHDRVISTRAKTLDKWATGETLDQKDVDNAALRAYTGDIAADIRAINTHSQRDGGHDNSPAERIQKWKKTFWRFYGLPFDQASDKVTAMPQDLLLVLNRRATVHSLEKWTRGECVVRRCMIVEKTDLLVRIWLAGDEDDFLQEGSSSRELFDDIEGDFASVP